MAEQGPALREVCLAEAEADQAKVMWQEETAPADK